jgi:hypothetical protein
MQRRVIDIASIAHRRVGEPSTSAARLVGREARYRRALIEGDVDHPERCLEPHEHLSGLQVGCERSRRRDRKEGKTDCQATGGYVHGVDCSAAPYASSDPSIISSPPRERRDQHHLRYFG